MNDWIGCHDNTPVAITPNIDRLAEQPKYASVKKPLSEKAPKTFAKSSPKRKKRDLILEGETFRWKQ
jgi:hypothetical protein